MKKQCKNCLHFSGRDNMDYGACFRYGGVCEVNIDHHCLRWEPTQEPAEMKWKHLHVDFNQEEDCTIVVPQFYSKFCGKLAGKVSEITVYVYKSLTGEFFCPYEYPVEYIPFNKMINVCYINLDEIIKPWEHDY